MKENFSKLFQNQSSNQFNKISISNTQCIVTIDTVGLHSIANASIVKEAHLHSHSLYELHFSLNGYAIYQFADKTQLKLEKGNWLLICATVPHKVIEYSSNYVKYSCSFKINETATEDTKCHISYQCIDELLKGKDIKSGEIPDSSAKCIKLLYHKMIIKHPFNNIIVRGLSENILLDTFSTMFEKTNYEDDQSTDVRFESAIQFIKDNIYNRIDSGDVARKVYLSTRQVDRMFQKKLSVSVTEFIFEQKCETAKILLLQTDIPILSISEKLRFSDPAYFSRFFKKRVGLSPQKFREKNKSETNVTADISSQPIRKY